MVIDRYRSDRGFNCIGPVYKGPGSITAVGETDARLSDEKDQKAYSDYFQSPTVTSIVFFRCAAPCYPKNPMTVDCFMQRSQEHSPGMVLDRAILHPAAQILVQLLVDLTSRPGVSHAGSKNGVACCAVVSSLY
ncbi:hypothetical protein EX30DRAFT_350282 [Ascodesmis nigricans]|uniref:Uncharacterized protein n=1 Tax=Ascodesmis nigricans TaxID=341454 RepID=A0A4S2MS69_9PEZI|nr:hypothetical protein EX30DRAFT_350282 [Ascodesmis nigricans]